MAVQSIDDLVASVAALDTVIDSAVALINGFSARLDQGIKDALQGGATAAELQPLTDLKTDVDTKAQALAAAVQANTPPAPPPAPPVPPPQAGKKP